MHCSTIAWSVVSAGRAGSRSRTKDVKSSRSLEGDGLVATRPIVSRRWASHCERDRRAARAAGEDLMHGVGQLDQHFVLTGRQSDHGDRIDVTRVRPMPGQVVDGYVQMPEPWRYVECTRAEHRYDMQVLQPLLDLDYTPGQLIGKRRVHDQLGRGLVLDGV